MEPLVSILIPAYNSEKWIAETLQSALDQTWTRKEVIVVDDGSKDQTLSVARQFASETVSVIAQQNQGAAAARNTAYAHSQGNYIQWLDADDLLAPDKIAKQMAAVKKWEDPMTLMSSPWGSFRYRPSKAVFSPTSLWADQLPVEWLIRKIGQRHHMQTATWLTSRNLTEAAGAWNTRLFVDDDGEYYCRVLIASNGVRFVQDARVFYRITDTSRVSHVGFSKRKLEAQFQSIQLHIRYLRSLEDSERVRAACVRYLQNYLIYFFPEMPDIVRQAESLARELNGRLEEPQLAWKYSWLKGLFGWTSAKRAQIFLPNLKSNFVNSWDKLLYRAGINV